MGDRFDDFGMPFPLFQAPIATACVDQDGTCGHCNAHAQFLFASACYDCFRAGKTAHVIDTELGMVRKEDAERGLTHGIPLQDPSELADYELVPHAVDPNFPDEHWYSVRLPVEELRELVRTPKFHSWQGERWLFCCKKACAFIGDLPIAALEAEAHGNDDALVKLISEAFDESMDDSWDLLERLREDGVSTYTFRCRACGRLRAYWDRD